MSKDSDNLDNSYEDVLVEESWADDIDLDSIDFDSGEVYSIENTEEVESNDLPSSQEESDSVDDALEATEQKNTEAIESKQDSNKIKFVELSLEQMALLKEQFYKRYVKEQNFSELSEVNPLKVKIFGVDLDHIANYIPKNKAKKLPVYPSKIVIKGGKGLNIRAPLGCYEVEYHFETDQEFKALMEKRAKLRKNTDRISLLKVNRVANLSKSQCNISEAQRLEEVNAQIKSLDQ